MVLPKETRALIHEARGRPVQIPWPPDAEPPKRGHVYSIQSKSRTAGTATILVLKWREFGPDEDGDGLLVTVQQQSDPMRTRVSKARRRQVAGSINTLVTHDPKAESGADFTETEPERVDALFEEELIFQAQARTALLKARHRCQAKVSRHNREISTAAAEGKPTALAEGRRDRALARLEEAEEHFRSGSLPPDLERPSMSDVTDEVITATLADLREGGDRLAA